MNKILLLALFLCGSAVAQTPREEILSNLERSAGVYHSYEYRPSDAVPVPKGYQPFYISHYGRHGSRYLVSEESYLRPLKTLRAAHAEHRLTASGEAALRKLEIMAEDARGRGGDLSPRGAEEHRGIAERMFAAYPEVFSTRRGRVCRVECRSTVVPRCILSMAAFNERLKELNPAIRITRESSLRYHDYLANDQTPDSVRRQVAPVVDSMNRARLHPQRLMQQLFTAGAPEGKAALKFYLQLYSVASIAQDASHLGLSFYELFTADELYELWVCENAKRYMSMGLSPRFAHTSIADARPLLRNIVETADSVVAGKTDLSASLRFGHDVYITPLLALMGIEGASTRVADTNEIASVWNDVQVTPMGVNLQLIFFRNASGDVRVRVLHNEHDAVLPVPGAPYYPWSELRRYLVSRCSIPVEG